MIALPAVTVNPGVQRLVGWLRSKGFDTTDSGDGVTNVAAGIEYALDFPHVAIAVNKDRMVQEADALADLLAEHGIPIHMNHYEERPWIDATYCPGDQTALIFLNHVSDKDLK